MKNLQQKYIYCKCYQIKVVYTDNINVNTLHTVIIDKFILRCKECNYFILLPASCPAYTGDRMPVELHTKSSIFMHA